MNSLEIKKVFDEKYFEDGVRHRVSVDCHTRRKEWQVEVCFLVRF